MKTDERIEKAVGELAAALYVKAKEDAQDAFDQAGSVVTLFSGFRMDLIRTKRVKI